MGYMWFANPCLDADHSFIQQPLIECLEWIVGTLLVLEGK